jgi:hypothetical protein
VSDGPPADLYPPVFLHWDMQRGGYVLRLPGTTHRCVELPKALTGELNALREAAIRAAKEQG